jgi:cytochrome P450
MQAVAAGDNVTLADYVFEALRFHPINPFVVRFCEQDYELASDTDRRALIKAGTVVLASTASAMMDDGEVDTPEEFRIGRPNYLNLHLGYGHHTCLGDQISMVQVPTIIQRLLLAKNLRRAQGSDGQVDLQGGPFPEKFVLQFDAQQSVAASGN